MDDHGGRNRRADGGEVLRAGPLQVLLERDRLLLDPALVEKFPRDGQALGEGNFRAEGDLGQGALAVEGEQQFPLRGVEADVLRLAFVGGGAFENFGAGHGNNGWVKSGILGRGEAKHEVGVLLAPDQREDEKRRAAFRWIVGHGAEDARFGNLQVGAEALVDEMANGAGDVGDGVTAIVLRGAAAALRAVEVLEELLRGGEVDEALRLALQVEQAGVGEKTSDWNSMVGSRTTTSLPVILLRCASVTSMK